MKVRLNSNNFNNTSANIIFVPDSNPSTSVNIGSQTIPYTYDAADVYGTYTLYFPYYDKTCSFHLVPTSINSIGIGNTYTSILRNDNIEDKSNIGNTYISIIRDDQINTSQDIYEKSRIGNAYMSILSTQDINTSSDIYERTRIGNTYVSILNSDPI